MKMTDISAWQENVDWEALAGEFDAVIIKLGERHNLDSMFIDHVNQAVAHGLRYGVYYYSHAASTDEAIEEANQVDAWIKEYLNGKNPEMGIWLDAEDKSMNLDCITDISMAFINQLWSIGYNYVGLYSSYNWLSNYYDLNVIKEVAVWVANYSHKNWLAAEHPELQIKIWQYTDHYSDEFPYDGDEYYE